MAIHEEGGENGITSLRSVSADQNASIGGWLANFIKGVKLVLETNINLLRFMVCRFPAEFVKRAIKLFGVAILILVTSLVHENVYAEDKN